MKTDEYWMNLALEEAKKAFSEDEVPIGAVIVRNEEIITADHNRTKQTNNPLAHAEKLAIDKVISSGLIHLQNCTLYVTVEPCLMCAGMIIWSRIGKVVYAAKDEKSGCVGSVYNVLRDKSFNHNPEWKNGVLEKEAAELIKEFFRKKR